jgi:RIO-like serine/threonine protein kinase
MYKTLTGFVEPYKLESGHLTENGQVISILIKKLEDRMACIEDILACEVIVRRLYILGIVHRDLNRHNFVVNKQSRIICLINFKNTKNYLNLKTKEKIDLLKN